MFPMLPPRRIPKLKPPRSTRRARALAAWRGIDVTALEIAAQDSARPLNELVGSLVGSLGLDRKRAEAEITKVWNSLIDPTVTAHAQPTGVRKGTLFVSVDSSVWLDEIVRYRRKEILTRMQTSFGSDVVQRISFRVG
jgi:hypothetical protein